MRKVAVLFGGKSCENEISVLTGVFVLKLLEGGEFTPVPVYIHTDGKMYSSPKMNDLNFFRKNKLAGAEQVLFEGTLLYTVNFSKGRMKKFAKIDVAINCCHGGLGEGGGVSAMMEWNGIPFASPDLTSSGVFMDKSLTKVAIRGLGVPTLDYIRVNEKDYEKRGAFLLRSIENRLKYPVVIKPAHLGSSIGISVAKDETEAKRGIENAFLLDNRLIIEKFLEEKRDVNCAVYSLNGEICVSEPENAFGKGIYSFEEKYVRRKSDGVQGKLTRAPAPTPTEKEKTGLGKELREKIRTYTKTVYRRMNMQGVVRMDFLVSKDEAYLCEVNTVPGSLAYYLFCERLVEAKEFFCGLLKDAIARAEKEGEKKILTTGILQTVEWKRK